MQYSSSEENLLQRETFKNTISFLGPYSYRVNEGDSNGSHLNSKLVLFTEKKNFHKLSKGFCFIKVL